MGFDCWKGKAGGENAEVLVGVAVLLGAGEMDAKPTMSFRLALLEPETGVGAANWVLKLVVEVFGGGGTIVDGLDVV